MESDLLLVDFASRHPREMANLLAGVETETLLTLVEQLPFSVAAQLCASLPSAELKRLLRGMSPGLVSSLLLAARHEQAIALVSHIPESAYSDILAATERRRRGAVTRLFDVPMRSVAALAVPEFMRVLADTRCEDIIKQLAGETPPFRLPILVVDEQGTFVGELDPADIIIAASGGAMARQVVRPLDPLNGRVSAEDALGAAEWEDHLQLPVVDAKHRLIGVVERDVLARHARTGDAPAFGLDALLIGMARWYLDFCSHTLRLLLSRGSR